MEMRLRVATSAKNVRCSSKGRPYAFLKVGPNPTTSTVVNITTAHNGSEVKYQNGKAVIADIKNNQSVRVIVLSDFFV